MGLDTMASRPSEPGTADEGWSVRLTEEDVAAFRTARVVLCECDGNASFRGKLYTSLTLEIARVSLTQEWIPPEVVRRMAAALETCDPVEAARAEPQVSPADVVELGRFLRLCADRGLGLIGSW